MPIDLNEHLRQKNRNYKPNNDEGNKNNDNNKKGFNAPKMPSFNIPTGKTMGVIWVVLIIIVLGFLLKPFSIINSGEVGIKVTAGEFDNVALQPGIHFYVPGIQKIIPINIKVRKAEFVNGTESSFRRGDNNLVRPAISVMDYRGLSVAIELAVQYSLEPLAVPQTIETFGLDWEEKIITPVIGEIVRNVVGSFPTEELPTKRNEIAALINEKFRTNIDSLKNKPVKLESIQLTDIILPLEIKKRIEAVQVAKQEAERARYEVERAKQEAEKKATLAQGVADATIIEADAQARANRLISQSLSNPLLQLKQIEVQGKFNEALQTNKDAKIFLTPGGAVPNIWLDSKSAQRSMSVGQ